MFDKFKTAWKKSGDKKMQDKCQSRYGKTVAALEKIDQSIDTLEFMSSQGVDKVDDTVASAKRALKLLDDRLDAAHNTYLAGKLKAAYDEMADIKKQSREIAERVEARRDFHLFESPKNTIELDMGDDWQGPPPKVHPAAIKGFEALDKTEAEAALKVVGEKIKNGKALLDRLLTDPAFASDPSVAPQLQEVTDLMWYLRNKAEESMGQAFEKGALSIPDEGNLLRGYFDRCQEVYNRYSSHIKAQQDKVGGSARAVDAYEGDIKNRPDALLPYGMNTMLIQSLQMEGSGEQRLYVKLETEGARFGAPGAGGVAKGFSKPTKKGKEKSLDVDPQLLKARADLDAATLPTSRPATPEDMERTVEHGKNLGRMMVGMAQHSRLKGFGRFAEDSLDGKKADYVKDTPYGEIIDIVKKLKSPELLAIVENGNYKAEVNQMVDNLKTLGDTDVTALIPGGVKVAAKNIDAIGPAIDKFLAFLDKHGLGSEKESRVGGEVVLSADFLKPKGADNASVTKELTAKLSALQQRDPDEKVEGRLQTLINGALTSAAKAANFATDAKVKAALASLNQEVDAVRAQIKGLTRFDAGWAAKRLQELADRLEDETSNHAFEIITIDSKQAQALYDEAVTTAYDIKQLAHLAGDAAVQKAADDMAQQADAFVEVIEALEEAEETV